MKTKVEISVIVPVFNEEKSILPFIDRIVPILAALGTYEIIFCVDPSTDATEHVIKSHIANNKNIRALIFTRRFGQPAATIAGINHSIGRWTVVIDVDLQDPPEVISKMYEKAKQGFDVITAKRRSREGEIILKKLVSYLGYTLINKISDVRIPNDTGDFRMFNARVRQELVRLPERHGFLRGLVALVGFSQTEVIYEREKRLYDKSKYNQFVGSIKIGMNGIFGFSNAPINFVAWLGGIFLLISSVSICTILIKYFMNDNYPIGYPTLVILILLNNSLVIICLAIVGQYVGRIYDEVRGRPQFIVNEYVNMEIDDN